MLDLSKYIRLESGKRNKFMRLFWLIVLSISLTACNSVFLKPDSLDKTSLIFARRGGYSMERSIKETMENRGYKTTVGILKSASSAGDRETVAIPVKARYVVRVEERQEILRPIWCAFNGFWWWNFNVSISDRTNGTEILSWRGRGCANSSVDKLNSILDTLEIKSDK